MIVPYPQNGYGTLSELAPLYQPVQPHNRRIAVIVPHPAPTSHPLYKNFESLLTFPRVEGVPCPQR